MWPYHCKNKFYLQMENPFSVIDKRLDRIESLVLELTSKSAQSILPDSPDLLSIDEAVLLLNLAKPTVYNLVSSGKIPVMKKSKRLYFSRDELLRWLRTGRRRTVEEIEEEARAYVIGNDYRRSKK
ncbi:helix-turn-helix domain-containing protein [Dyadobacter flavalbus]|uniref:Helix-turn-helix domain-containing protein n=1 Tax=Dyadobacter flavalbus TaxID=2579942 RepID=A0A5M8R0K5_9BACT|nr:helix-turn-helix domain-containing protein [Dyadobacter flavalbus]